MFKNTSEVFKFIFSNFKFKTEVLLCIIIGFCGDSILKNLFYMDISTLSLFTIQFLSVVLIIVIGRFIRKLL